MVGGIGSENVYQQAHQTLPAFFISGSATQEIQTGLAKMRVFSPLKIVRRVSQI